MAGSSASTPSRDTPAGGSMWATSRSKTRPRLNPAHVLPVELFEGMSIAGLRAMHESTQQRGMGFSGAFVQLGLRVNIPIFKKGGR